MTATYDLPEAYRERLRAGGRASVEVRLERARARANQDFADLDTATRERIARSLYNHEMATVARKGGRPRKNLKTAV